MKTTLEAMIVPTGDMPYRKTLQADENGSFLRALQECVGGRIEAMGWVFGDEPTVYCNEEGLLPGSGCAPNRAIYADAAMAEAGYASQDDPSRPVEPGELYHIAYGDHGVRRVRPRDGRGPRHHARGVPARHGALRERGVHRFRPHRDLRPPGEGGQGRAPLTGFPGGRLLQVPSLRTRFLGGQAARASRGAGQGPRKTFR